MDPWTRAMLRGEFEAAWRISDQVLEHRRGRDCSTWPRHLQYIWDGTPLHGKHVLVRCYHGLGDTIQFVRLMKPLRARARRTTLWVQPALMDLLRGVHGIDHLLALDDGVPGVDFDVDMELMELPHALRLTRTGIPAETPYIRAPHPDALPARRVHGVRSTALRVGLVWRAGDWRPERSIPESLLEPLSRVRGVEWLSLQYPAHAPPFDMPSIAHGDLTKLASSMQTLDLVISVDTMNAHLAGALGLPVWTLLTADCDWRWMAAGRRSPWYPTMRLLRQRRCGDWTAVLDEVARRLRTAAERSFIPGRDTHSAGCKAS